MRYPASEKLEHDVVRIINEVAAMTGLIRRVEQSHLGVGSTVDKLGIPKTTFYRCYDRFLAFGDAGLEDRNSSPGRVWNRIPDDVRGQTMASILPWRRLATVAPGTGPSGLRTPGAGVFFVSQASVDRLLKAHDLITSPLSWSSRQPMSSATRPRRRTRCGRPTSPISRSSAGAGFTCRASWTTIPAPSLRGSSAPT